MHLDHELLMNVHEVMVQEVLQRQDPQRWRAWPLEVDYDQLRATIEADSLKTNQEVAEELNIDHCMVIWHLK